MKYNGIKYFFYQLTRACVSLFSLFLSIDICYTQAPGFPAHETRIAFGSCGHQDKPQPALSLAADYNPHAFIFLGDNIYGDTYQMDTLRAKYRRWMAKPEFQKLKRATTVLAVWDDHDYGLNDGGREYRFKDSSQAIFAEVFEVPATSRRRREPGNYDAVWLCHGRRRIQIILLDNRYFRNGLVFFDPRKDARPPGFFYDPDYKVHTSTDSTLLGEQQWAWLRQELLKPADVRLICSGSQFGITYNGYEAWANFPHEQQRMIQLIKETQANGVIFLTGDVHYGEISRLQAPGLYPLYDVTASGITSTWEFATPNLNRIEGPVMDNHFGLLRIQWKKDPLISMQIIDVHNNQRVEYSVKLSELQFRK